MLGMARRVMAGSARPGTARRDAAVQGRAGVARQCRSSRCWSRYSWAVLGSHGVARDSTARPGTAWPGLAVTVRAWLGRGARLGSTWRDGMECGAWTAWRGSQCTAWDAELVGAVLSSAWPSRLGAEGKDGLGRAGSLGMAYAWVAGLGAEREAVRALQGIAWLVGVRLGRRGCRGMARRVTAIPGWHSAVWPGRMARRGLRGSAVHGMAGPGQAGWARRGMARSCDAQHGEAGRGLAVWAMLGKARLRGARRGVARQSWRAEAGRGYLAGLGRVRRGSQGEAWRCRSWLGVAAIAGQGVPMRGPGRRGCPGGVILGKAGHRSA
jgi:hypothetical protein